MTERLGGKKAIVTGAARGIGLAIARALAREGAAVAIADVNGEGASQAAAALAKDGFHCLGTRVDVADPASVDAMVAEVAGVFGGLDILVNNAGIGGNTPFLEIGLAEWNRIIGVNLTGAFLMAQAAAREMVKGGGGKIVNITSVSGQRGGNGRAAYGSAKAGLEVLTRIMAVELAEHGINVNAIAPGAVETEMAKFAHDAESRAAYNYLIPHDPLRHARGDCRRGRVPVLRRKPICARPYAERRRGLQGGRPHVWPRQALSAAEQSGRRIAPARAP